MKNEALFQRIKKLVSVERRIGVEILECLYEIDRRKAYSELKYDGLFTFCVRELGFSDSQAYQRIQAMRALKEIPELKPKIESGALSVSNVSKMQTYLKHEAKTVQSVPREKKIELFSTLENRTTKEADAIISDLRGESARTKIVLELDAEALELWKRVKGLAAHRANGGGDLDTFLYLTQEWLKRNDPERAVRTDRLAFKEKNDREPRERNSAEGSKALQPEVPQSNELESGEHSSAERELERLPSKEHGTKNLRHDHQSRSIQVNIGHPRQNLRERIPNSLRRAVFRNYRSQCARCGSRHALEIDHVQRVSHGGTNQASNLRLLCRNCNQARNF